jgi:L-aminopeptidase/D-esterase-like protein
LVSRAAASWGCRDAVDATATGPAAAHVQQQQLRFAERSSSSSVAVATNAKIKKAQLKGIAARFLR